MSVVRPKPLARVVAPSSSILIPGELCLVTKTCRACAVDLPLPSFHRDVTKKDGYRSQCKNCERSRKRARYIAVSEKLARQQTTPGRTVVPPIPVEAAPLMSLCQRLASKIEVLPNGCWRWGGALDRRGYGRVSLGGRMYFTHRVMYFICTGYIPMDLDCDHLCRNPSCVNPQHLEMVSHRENVLRGEAPAAKSFRENACKRGHPYTPESTRTRHDGTRQCRWCMNAAARRSYYRKRGRVESQ